MCMCGGVVALCGSHFMYPVVRVDMRGVYICVNIQKLRTC